MYRAPTFRHANQPLRLCGLELEDWGLFFILVLIGLFLLPRLPGLGDGSGQLAGVGIAIGTTYIVYRIKRGRPREYLKYIVHRTGLTRILPFVSRPAGTLPAPAPGGPKVAILVLAPPKRRFYAP